MTADEGRREDWTRAVVVILFGGAHVGAGTQAVATLISGDRWSWPEALLSAGTWAVAMRLVSGLARRGWLPARGDREGRALLRNGLATGELPPDARPDAWRHYLTAEIRDLRQTRWVVLLLMLAVVVLVAIAAAVHDDRGVSALAIVLAGFVGAPFRLLKVRRQRAQALLDRVLDGRSA